LALVAAVVLELEVRPARLLLVAAVVLEVLFLGDGYLQLLLDQRLQ
jgi:hypothetical protein